MAASTTKPDRKDRKPREHPSKPSTKKGKGKEDPNVGVTPIEEQPWEDETPWNCVSLTDHSSTQVPPVFTKDGSYFFSLAGSSVKIYSAATGLVVSTLFSPPSDENNIQADVLTSAIINPQNSFQLITGSLDGRLLIWDFVNATLLQTVNVGQPIHLICAHDTFKGSVFVAASKARKNASVPDKNAVILQVVLRHADHTSQPVEITPIGKTRFPTGLAISSNGAWLVATAGHKVYVAKTSALSDGFTKYVSTNRLTCLAFHPSEEYFATGDDKGVVRLWYCLNDNLAVTVKGVEKRTQTRPFHWHAHAVSSLAFSPNGAYLLSGGEEAVLVIWQLHTGKKEFVPRVGAPIGTISVTASRNREEEYLLGLADATYVFVSSASLKITRSYSRLKLDPSLASDSSASSVIVPIAFQPRNSSILLPSSHPSSLQIYAPFTSTLLAELEVSSSNRVSRRDEKPIQPARVEKVVVCVSGSWMATVDYRDMDGGFYPEVYLKIWSWSETEENWTLKTRINRPHGRSRVTDLKFSPSTDASQGTLVSSGDDNQIRVWHLRWTASAESYVWSSHAVFECRSKSSGTITWAPDSSLFAVAAGAQVCLYDPNTTNVVQTLTIPNCPAITSAHFVGPSSRYIVAVCSQSLSVWDLVHCRVLWETRAPWTISRVVPHPRQAMFAVFYTTGPQDQQAKLSIFKATSSTPISNHSIPVTLRNIEWASSQPVSGFSLVGVTQAWKVVLIGDSVEDIRDEGRAARSLRFEKQSQARTLFEDIFGSSAFADVSVELPPIPTKLNQVTHEAFELPAYSIPPLHSFFDSVMTSMLTEAQTEVLPKEDDEDVAMDEDNVLPVESHAPRVPRPGEFEALTNLFRRSCAVTTPVPKPKVNGVPAKAVNGTAVDPPITRSPVKKTKASLVGQNDVPSSEDPAVLVNGKKSKKVA